MVRLELARRTGDIELTIASVGQLEKHAGTLSDETLAHQPRLVVRMLAVFRARGYISRYV